MGGRNVVYSAPESSVTVHRVLPFRVSLVSTEAMRTSASMVGSYPPGRRRAPGVYSRSVPALRLSPVLAAWAQVAAELVNTRPRETDPPEKLVALADLERLLARCPE